MLERKEKWILAMAIFFASANTVLAIGAVGTFYEAPPGSWQGPLVGPKSASDPLEEVEEIINNLPVCVIIHDWLLPWNCFNLECICADLDPTDPCNCSP